MARLTSASWWFRSKDGHLTLAQPPNPPLLVWLAAVGLGAFDLAPAHEAAVTGVRHGALLAWAADELLRGDSPFRRVLGAGVLVLQVAALM